MKKILFSIVATALLAGGAYAKTSAEVSKESLKQAKQEAKNSQVELVKEAVKSLLLTQKVLVDIDKKDTKQAIKDIEEAIGKLEVILTHKDSPKLLPVDSRVSVVEFVGNLDKVKSDIKLVKTLLSDGKIQEARVLLNTLQSQINVLTVSLPLVTYPDALKLAAKYLHEEKNEEAKAVLETALNTLVEEKVIIPIPILKAEGLIKAASLIAKSDKKQALKHLSAAQEELKIAQALGYTSKSDITYKVLDEAISKVKKEIKGKNKVEKLFESLLKKIKDFKDKDTKTYNKENKEK